MMHPESIQPPLVLDQEERDVLWRVTRAALAVHAEALHGVAIDADLPDLGEARTDAEVLRIAFEVLDGLDWAHEDQRSQYEIPLPRGAAIVVEALEQWHQAVADLHDLDVLDRIISRLAATELGL